MAGRACDSVVQETDPQPRGCRCNPKKSYLYMTGCNNSTTGRAVPFWQWLSTNLIELDESYVRSHLPVCTFFSPSSMRVSMVAASLFAADWLTPYWTCSFILNPSWRAAIVRHLDCTFKVIVHVGEEAYVWSRMMGFGLSWSVSLVALSCTLYWLQNWDDSEITCWCYHTRMES